MRRIPVGGSRLKIVSENEYVAITTCDEIKLFIADKLFVDHMDVHNNICEIDVSNCGELVTATTMYIKYWILVLSVKIMLCIQVLLRKSLYPMIVVEL